MNLLRSFRVRLVLTLAAVVGMICAVLGLGGAVIYEWRLRARFDDQLDRNADAIARWIEQRPASARADEVDRWLNQLASPLGDLYLQLSAADGSLVARSDGLGSMRLPSTPVGPRTIHHEALRRTPGLPDSLRVVVRPIHVGAGRPPLTLHVARSYDDVTGSLAFLQVLFWVVTASSVLVAALAGWIVTGRAMGRVDELSQLARGMTPHRLDQRLAVSPRDDEIGRLGAEMNRMLSRLESSFKAQERFIANASHELQTPVAVLLSEAQLLKNAQPPATLDQHQRFVHSVEQEMRQLTRIIGSLLSLIRVESGELRRAERLVPLNEVLATAVEDCAAAAQRRGVPVRLTLPDPEATTQDAHAPADAPAAAHGDEPTVAGDPELLQIMVENLLRNAIRNAPRGEPVSVSLEVDLDQAVITVSDCGPALTERGIQAAFDRGQPMGSQVDGRLSSGVELAVAQTIADVHGGAIGVRNRRPSTAAADRAPAGVAFFVYLPLQPT